MIDESNSGEIADEEEQRPCRERPLDGKVALITGASRGLGKAMALALSRAGASVALVSRDLDRLNDVRNHISSSGRRAFAFQADVSSESDVSRLRDETLSRLAGIDILINNAGANIRKDLVDFTLDEWNSVIDTNLTSVFLMCRAYVPQMRGSGYGRVINLTSIMSHISLPGRTAYSSSKAALLGLTRALAQEVAASGITVNGISPGPIATDMNLDLMNNPDVNQEFIKNIPVGRWGSAEEVAALAVFLCSKEAAFITGTDIIINGGWCSR